MYIRKNANHVRYTTSYIQEYKHTHTIYIYAYIHIYLLSETREHYLFIRKRKHRNYICERVAAAYAVAWIMPRRQTVYHGETIIVVPRALAPPTTREIFVGYVGKFQLVHQILSKSTTNVIELAFWWVRYILSDFVSFYFSFHRPPISYDSILGKKKKKKKLNCLLISDRCIP